MKKHRKRILALILSAAMVMGLNTGILAAEAQEIPGIPGGEVEVLPLSADQAVKTRGVTVSPDAVRNTHKGNPVSWNAIEDPGYFRQAFGYQGIQSEHIVDGQKVPVSNNGNAYQKLLELNQGVVSGNVIKLSKENYYMMIAYALKDDGRNDDLEVDQATGLNTAANVPVVTFSGRKYQGPQTKSSTKANNYIQVIASLIKYDPAKDSFTVIANSLSANSKGKKELIVKASAKNNLYATVSRGSLERVKTGFNHKGSGDVRAPYFTVSITAKGELKKKLAGEGLAPSLKAFNTQMKKTENRYGFEIRRAILAVSNNQLTDSAKRKQQADMGEHDNDFKDSDTVIDGFAHHGFGATNVATYRKKAVIKNDHYAAMNLKYKTVRFKNKERLYAMKQAKKAVTEAAEIEKTKADFWTDIRSIGDQKIIVIRPLGNFESGVSVLPAYRNATYTNAKGKSVTELRSGIYTSDTMFYVDSAE